MNDYWRTAIPMQHASDCIVAWFLPLRCALSLLQLICVLFPRLALKPSPPSPGRLIASPPAPPHRSPANIPASRARPPTAQTPRGLRRPPPASHCAARTSSTETHNSLAAHPGAHVCPPPRRLAQHSTSTQHQPRRSRPTRLSTVVASPCVTPSRLLCTHICAGS